jgi:hypothetical protein
MLCDEVLYKIAENEVEAISAKSSEEGSILVFRGLCVPDICLRHSWELYLGMPALPQYCLPSIVYMAFNSWMGCGPKLCKVFWNVGYFIS